MRLTGDMPPSHEAHLIRPEKGWSIPLRESAKVQFAVVFCDRITRAKVRPNKYTIQFGEMEPLVRALEQVREAVANRELDKAVAASLVPQKKAAA